MKFPLLLILIVVLALVWSTGCVPDDDTSESESSKNDGTNDDDDDDNDNNDNDNDDDNDTVLDPTDYVDPFMATMADHGQLSPAVSVPFGMVKLGPDTMIRSHSGYDYGVPAIFGFSHMRIDGVGSNGAGGNIRVLPGIGAKTTIYQWIGKQTEVGYPGYYAVELGDEGQIYAEMTATEHCGLHRYHFNKDGQPYLFINFNSPFTDSLGSDWEINDSNDEINGWVAAKNVGNKGRYQMHFSIKFDHTIADVFEVDSITGGKNARLEFELPKGEALLVKTGLSSVSADEAKNDLGIEIPDWDFERVRSETRQAWKEHLGVVEIEGPEELISIFYTMLYRASHTPVNVTTHSGYYWGTDGQVHQAQGYRRHHCWSLWDTYRNKFALHNLLYPERSGEIMQSLVDFYIEGKAAESTDNEPYPNVRTEHAPALLLDAYRKGITGFDIAPAYDEILAEPLPGGSPDREIEGSYDRWAIAHLAKILGDNDTYDTLIAEAALYEDGWVDTFRDMGSDADIVGAQGVYQGTLWQYRWAVVHDLEGIMTLDGGRDVFLGKLIQFFDEELYNHGNEPDIHVPFLYNYAGAPFRTQDLVRALLSERVRQWYGGHEKWPFPAVRPIYRLSPWGFLMNMDDDAGTMSAWFVFGAIGLYPVTIGHPVYALTAPLFPKVIINLENGSQFKVFAEGVSEENRYVQSVSFNGEPLPRAWLHHDEVATGGELVFQMGTEPNETWGAAAQYAPPPAFE